MIFALPSCSTVDYVKGIYHENNARVVYYRSDINNIPDAVATASTRLGLSVTQTRTNARKINFEGGNLTIICEKSDDRVKILIRCGYIVRDKEQEELVIEQLDKILGDNASKRKAYDVAGRKILVESFSYNDPTREGKISVNLAGWDLKEARAWVIENISQVAASKNILLKSGGEEVQSPASFRTLGESVTNGILTMEFKAEY
ncbi:MAG: hypothetical protein WC637_11950 [Victivallales bacterium]